MITFKTFLTEESWGKFKKRVSVPQPTINRIEEIDPTPQNKYSIWLFNNLGDWVSPDENKRKSLEIFHRHENEHKTDINSLTIDQLFDVIDKYSQNEQTKEAVTRGVDRIVDNEDYTILHIKSYEASCKYGFGTKWCISMRDDKSYWKDYSRRAVFMFIIFKNAKYYKEALTKFNKPSIARETYGGFENVQKISVQIDDAKVLNIKENTHGFQYWDVQDKPANLICNWMGKVVMSENFAVIKEVVKNFRDSEEKESNAVLKAFQKRINLVAWSTLSEDLKQNVLSDIENGIEDNGGDFEDVSVDENGIYVTWKGWYTENWDIFKWVFDNQDFAENVLTGDWYPDSYMSVADVKNLIEEKDVDAFTRGKIKEIILKAFYEEFHVDLYNHNGDLIDDAPMMDREELEELVSPYYTWLLNDNDTEALSEINSAFEVSASKADERNTLHEYENEIISMIDNIFNIIRKDGKLISHFDFQIFYDIMYHMDEEDEGVYEDDEGITFDLNTILERIIDESNQSNKIQTNPYWGGIDDDDERTYFNEDLLDSLP